MAYTEFQHFQLGKATGYQALAKFVHGDRLNAIPIQLQIIERFQFVQLANFRDFTVARKNQNEAHGELLSAGAEEERRNVQRENAHGGALTYHQE